MKNIITNFFLVLIFISMFIIFLLLIISAVNIVAFKNKIMNISKIIKSGAATDCYTGSGGWLFCTKEVLYFKPHKINFSVSEKLIPISKIVEIKNGKRINSIELVMTDSTHEFLVFNRKKWIKYIMSLSQDMNLKVEQERKGEFF